MHRAQMNIERSLSQVSKEGLQHSDFSGAGGWGGVGEGIICSALSFQKVSQKESCSKQNDFSYSNVLNQGRFL